MKQRRQKRSTITELSNLYDQWEAIKDINNAVGTLEDSIQVYFQQSFMQELNNAKKQQDRQEKLRQAKEILDWYAKQIKSEEKPQWLLNAELSISEIEAEQYYYFRYVRKQTSTFSPKEKEALSLVNSTKKTPLHLRQFKQEEIGVVQNEGNYPSVISSRALHYFHQKNEDEANYLEIMGPHFENYLQHGFAKEWNELGNDNELGLQDQLKKDLLEVKNAFYSKYQAEFGKGKSPIWLSKGWEAVVATKKVSYFNRNQVNSLERGYNYDASIFKRHPYITFLIVAFLFVFFVAVLATLIFGVLAPAVLTGAFATVLATVGLKLILSSAFLTLLAQAGIVGAVSAVAVTAFLSVLTFATYLFNRIRGTVKVNRYELINQDDENAVGIELKEMTDKNVSDLANLLGETSEKVEKENNEAGVGTSGSAVVEEEKEVIKVNPVLVPPPKLTLSSGISKAKKEEKGKEVVGNANEVEQEESESLFSQNPFSAGLIEKPVMDPDTQARRDETAVRLSNKKDSTNASATVYVEPIEEVSSNALPALPARAQSKKDLSGGSASVGASSLKKPRSTTGLAKSVSSASGPKPRTGKNGAPVFEPVSKTTRVGKSVTQNPDGSSARDIRWSSVLPLPGNMRKEQLVNNPEDKKVKEDDFSDVGKNEKTPELPARSSSVDVDPVLAVEVDSSSEGATLVDVSSVDSAPALPARSSSEDVNPVLAVEVDSSSEGATSVDVSSVDSAPVLPACRSSSEDATVSATFSTSSSRSAFFKPAADNSEETKVASESGAGLLAQIANSNIKLKSAKARVLAGKKEEVKNDVVDQKNALTSGLMSAVTAREGLLNKEDNKPEETNNDDWDQPDREEDKPDVKVFGQY